MWSALSSATSRVSAGSMFMLVDGLALDQQTRTEEIANTMSDIKLTDLRAKQELHGDAFAQKSADLFAQECEPLRDLQKALVRVMRGAQ